jgi:hypothetical protein
MSSRYTGFDMRLCVVAGPDRYDDLAIGCVCCAQFLPPSPHAAPLQATTLQHVIYGLGFECVFMHGLWATFFLLVVGWRDALEVDLGIRGVDVGIDPPGPCGYPLGEGRELVHISLYETRHPLSVPYCAT